MEKTFRENGSEQKTKKLGVNFNPQFSVIQPSNSLRGGALRDDTKNGCVAD